MSLPSAPPLPPGCPWSGWTPPNIQWCEENLCGWITTPANAWSNLAYLLVAAILWRRSKSCGHPALAWFSPACLFLGGSSFLFHASYTLFFQLFDYLGMFVILVLLMGINLQRAGIVPAAHVGRWTLAGVTTLGAALPLLYLVRFPYQLLIVALTLVVIVQEIHLGRRGPRPPSYRWFYAACVSIAIAAVFTVLDLTRCWCDPANHWLQGHALWHIFSAIALYCAFRFFEMLPIPDDRDCG